MSSKQFQGLLLAHSAFVAAAAAGLLVLVLASPSEADRALAFGLSAPRLGMGAGLLVGLLLSAGLALRSLKDPAWATDFVDAWFLHPGRSRVLAWAAALSLGLGWIGLCLPAYRLGLWAAYWERVQPLAAFSLAVGLAALSLSFLVRWRGQSLRELALGVPLFGIALAGLALMFLSGLGVRVWEEDFWYVIGVPLLASQVLLGVLAGSLILWAGPGRVTNRGDGWIALLLFAGAAGAWAGAPLQKSFFFPGPYAPAGVLFPFADAATFDLASQFPLIGERIQIYGTLFFERPLYLSFLTYLHAFFGQDYSRVLSAQAAALAVFPVLVYLIGRTLGTRPVGLAAAVLVLLRGVNAIQAGNLIDTASPKMILTDFPTALGLALVIWLTCVWLADPPNRRLYPLWIGGAIGATLMLRTNALLLLPGVPALALFAFRRNWRAWSVSLLLIGAGLLAVTLPWELRNHSLGGAMYAPIVAKFQQVLQTRYPGFGPPIPEGVAPGRMRIESLRPLQTLVEANAAAEAQRCVGVPCFALHHFLHNVLSSVLVLPASPAWDELRYLIKERLPFWQTNWEGQMPGPAWFLVLLNLFLVCTGLARAWRERGLTGIAPLLLFAIYNLSNGLARTSGGRYLVPLDWIPVLYYLLGIFHLLTWTARAGGQTWELFEARSESRAPNASGTRARLAGAGLVLCLLGTLVPLAEYLFPPRYADVDARALATAEQVLSPEQLDSFLKSPGAGLLVGRVLYPRYYKMNQGEYEGVFLPYQTLGYPRTAFKLIGPAGEQSVILAGLEAWPVAHGSDAVVVGCRDGLLFNALAVLVPGAAAQVYQRNPQAPLQCPIPIPVCSNNSVCQ